MPVTTLQSSYANPSILRKKHKIFGLTAGPSNSNHLTPTLGNGVFNIKNPVFAGQELSVPVKKAISTRKRKPLKSRSGYPYHPAQLTPADLDITKVWYITFYAWDIGREQLVRKRVLKDELNAITDREQRKEYAQRAIEKINDFLKNDYHLDRQPVPKLLAMDFKGYSVLNAITYAINEKREVKGIKESSLGKYESAMTTVKDFLRFKGLPDNYPLRNVNATFAAQYFEYIKKERKVQNNTANDRRGFLHAMFEVLIRKSDNQLFRGKNPWADVPVLPVQARKHAAYTDHQLKSIVSYAISRGDHHVVLFIQFMYYTLARPEELRNLKVGNIDMERRKILFKAAEAKTAIEEYVGINDRFFEIILASGIMSYPANYYVFSNDVLSARDPGYLGQGNIKVTKNPGRKDERGYAPGITRVGMNYFADMISQYVKALKLHEVNPNFTPYAIKHTGAIGLYLATKDPKVVQLQCRHKKMETTLKYLRDLGVFIDFDSINKWNGPV
jgi:integrase